MCMNAGFKKKLFGFLMFASISGCKEPYDPPTIIKNPHYLVVDGFLENGSDPTSIKLSRTRNFNDSLSYIPELNAQVQVIGDGGDTYSLSEQGNGVYAINSLFLSAFEKYQLQIITEDGRKYASDLMVPKQTPPIDSVNWALSDKGVQIYVNTHDPQNNTKYYKWDYEETWQYHAAYDSYFTFENRSLKPRALDKHLFTCWKTLNSTELLLASTDKLSQDIVYLNPVIFIPRESQKLGVKYSIIVKQHAISKESFNYWENLRRNTELTGSLFDPLPSSQLAGNFHCISNPGEQVLGYVDVSAVQEQRIFIDSKDLPWGYIITGCEQTILTPDQFSSYFSSGSLVPISQAGLVNFAGSTADCIDCTLQGGTTTKPLFWP